MAIAPSNVNKYPYPTEIDATKVVQVKLSRTNYYVWKSLLNNLLRNNGLLGFINGNTLAPTENADDYISWKRSDELVQSWIRATVSQDILLTLSIPFPTAKEMWDKIQAFCTTTTTTTTINGDNIPLEHHVDIGGNGGPGKGRNKYQERTLSKAALNGDWETAREIIDLEPDVVKDSLNGALETALMIAVRSTKRNHFVEQLVGKMSPADLEIGNYNGFTALHLAARVGNTKAAMLLVSKNPKLPNLPDKMTRVPLHFAACNSQKEMVLYLIKVTKADQEPNPFEGKLGVLLVSFLINAGLYGIALDLVKIHPKVAYGNSAPLEKAYGNPTPLDEAYGNLAPLEIISRKCSAFYSGARLNFYQRYIYSCVQRKMKNIEDHVRSGNNNANISTLGQKLQELFWKVAERSVPQVRYIRDMKLIHYQALQLVKLLCKEIVKVDHEKALKLLGTPLQIAAFIGINEVVEEILDSLPSAIYFVSDATGQTIFHIAIAKRRENIFNIIYQVSDSCFFLGTVDKANNTCLHLAGKLDDEQKLDLRTMAAGAALQMQRELQWFKAVEKCSLVQDREIMNKNNKTAAKLFTETHAELVKEGELWMKDTANSCTIVAALIVTIVFAAAITVPGGNSSDTGLPFLAKEKAFIIFAISDALALFSSTSSVLMFLSILTSRYGEEDFLYSLPRRLIAGLATLFLSIIFMMIAFGATLEIMFGDKHSWILIPVVALSCLPVMLFMTLQFPLLRDMIKSTYGTGIFRQQSNSMLY